MIRKLLNETSEAAAQWVWWMDADTLVADVGVVPRFDKYEGYDLVVWGDRAKLMQGDMNGGAESAFRIVSARDISASYMPTSSFGLCTQALHEPCRELTQLPRDAGINCGVILIRNTEWAASFFEDVGQYAYMHPDTIEKHMRPVRSTNDVSYLHPTLVESGRARS